MNKKLIILVSILLVVAGVGIYLLLKARPTGEEFMKSEEDIDTKFTEGMFDQYLGNFK